jgi:hypothetical protein
MLKKRKVIFGEYDTAANGWTLTGCTLSDPEQKTNYVEKSGGDGSWDLSTVMTEGIPRYKDRSLTVRLENSEGTHDDREALINDMVNLLDGLTWTVVLPDRPDYYVTARLHVAVEYNNPAHAAVVVTGVCEPWLYRGQETVIERTATTATQSLTLQNKGRRAVVPQLETTGSIQLTYGATLIQLSAGVYEWPELLLTPGEHVLEYSGSGVLTIRYREAVLR